MKKRKELGIFILSISLILFGTFFLAGGIIYNATLSSVSEHNLTTTSGFAHLNISDPTMVLYFAFDDNNSLNQSYDYTNNSNNGTLLRSPSYVSGYLGGGYNFSGGYDYINVSDSTSLDITGNVTVSAWVNLRESQFQNVAPGQYHTCFVYGEGTASCSGYNAYGTLGDGTTTTQVFPTIVLGNYNFINMEGGADTSYAILDNGTVLSWGRNNYGQLGTGNSISQRNIPGSIYGDYTFLNLSIYAWHICGILTNGSAMCWGYNADGEMGNGTTGGISNVPIFVSGDYNFSVISSGGNQVCGVLTNGSALCWGDNAYGQLGNGNSPTDSNIPVFVSGDYNFSTLSSGRYHICGILTNGSAMCWGQNAYGQLGNGSTGVNSNIPIFISGDYNFSNISTSAISASAYSTCGILTNGSALCWGYNSLGTLANGSNVDGNIPTSVSGDYNFSYILPGGNHMCGALTNGSALCWGRNNQGQLGNGNSPTNSNIPVFVSGDHNFSNISLGCYHACGILTNGSLLCWGVNSVGELGDGTKTTQGVPVKILRGQIAGKGGDTFALASTFDNEIHSLVENSNATANSSLVSGWNHIVLVYNQAGNQELYINGSLIQSTANTGAYSANNNPLVIMQNTPGSIDEVMIFNRYLNSTQVQEIYNNQSERFYPTGEMTFEQSFGTNNFLNGGIDNCSTPNSTSIQTKTSSGSYSISGDNVTIKLVSDSSRFFTPLVLGNVSFTSYYVAPEEEETTQDEGGSTGTSSGATTSSGETIYVSQALNDNYWTSTEVIPPTSWTYSDEQEGDLENEEQGVLNAIESGEDITLIKKILRSFITSLTVQERITFDVKGENVSAGVAKLTKDYAIIQVELDQRNMTVGELESFDTNNDTLDDLDVQLDTIEEEEDGFKASITFHLVYQGILEEEEVAQLEQKEKSKQFLLIVLIAISFLVVVFQIYRFRKFRK